MGGVPGRVIRRESHFRLSEKLTRARLERMLTYMRAGLVALEIELKDPLAPDWQDRGWHELEAVRVALVQLQELIQKANAGGLS